MPARSAAFERFMASTDIDYERWHDGVPYDLEALAQIEGEERAEIERWLIGRANEDWRDLDGLLAIGTVRAKAAVVGQLRRGTLEQRLAAARRLAPDPAIEPDRERAVIDGLREAEWVTGLKNALDLAVSSPNPAIIDALFRAALRRSCAVHAAAALAFLHGHAKEAFDWDRRPFFLRLNDDDPAVRIAAFRALCRECGVDPEPYIRATLAG
jgi:hypothetical protein